MTWTRRDVAMVLFGACLGLWCSMWLACIHPIAPFLLAYPLGFGALWIIGNLYAERHHS